MASKSRIKSLVRRSDFLALKATGKVIHVNSWMLLNWRSSPEPLVRCGWTIPGYVGNAVVRNRLKRWGREYFRRNFGTVGRGGVDVNVILKRKSCGFYADLSHGEFDEALDRACTQLSRSLGG